MGIKTVWYKSQFPGVRFQRHVTRKVGGRLDQYFQIRLQRDGKRIEECVGWASEGWTAEKAYAVLAELKTNIRLGKRPQSLAEKKAIAQEQHQQNCMASSVLHGDCWTLNRFIFEKFMPFIKARKRSWHTDELRLGKFILPAFGEFPIADITPAVVQALIDTISDSGAAPATVVQHFAILRRVFNIAAKTFDGSRPIFTGQNPCAAVELPKIHNARIRFLSRAEADLLIAEAAKLRSSDLQHAIILALNTGLRAGELARLRWIDVNQNAALLTVPDENNRKPGGTVPLNLIAQQVFAARYSTRIYSEQLVFPPVSGRKKDFSFAFRELVARTDLNLGIDDRRHRVVFHTLRHTFASWLALAGVDIFRIKQLMRHKTLTMTMRYAHLLPDATRDAVNHLRPPNR